jgi:hypothetical protein
MAMHVHAQTYTLSWLYPLPIPFLSSSIALSPSSHYFFLFHSPGRTGMYLVFIPFDYRSPTESPAAFLFFKQRCISLTVSAHQIKTSQQHRKPSRATRRVTHETWCKKLDRPQQARTGQSTSTSRHTQHSKPNRARHSLSERGALCCYFISLRAPTAGQQPARNASA